MIYSKELSVKYDVDVFVAGGGAAGVAAAVAAAREGKTVFLAEAGGCFGGVGTSGLVPAFATFDDGRNLLCSGIGWEIRKAVSGAFPLDSYWTPIDAEELKRAYDDLMVSSGAKFSFFTSVCDVVTRGQRIDHVVLTAKSGMFAVKAKIYVDCTGDGDLCAFGGGKYEEGDEKGEVMPGTLCSLWCDVDHAKARQNGAANEFIEQAYREGVLTYNDRHLPGFFFRDGDVGCANVGHLFGIHPTDECSLTESMLWGRKSVLEYETYYKKYLKGYENMKLCATGSIPGVRESRRITCDYTLCRDDFLRRACFEDEIGRYSYPVDIHVMDQTKEEYERFEKEYFDLRYADGESYGIPYRSLIPVSFENVLVAGRCMGTDRSMQASIRVMPGCFITGQAAGIAASLACGSEETREVAYPLLRDRMRAQGMYLHP